MQSKYIPRTELSQSPERPVPFLLTLEVHHPNHTISAFQYQSSDLPESTAAEIDQKFSLAHSMLSTRHFSAGEQVDHDSYKLIMEKGGKSEELRFFLGDTTAGLYDLVQGMKARGRKFSSSSALTAE